MFVMLLFFDESLTQNSVFKIFREGILSGYLKWATGTDLFYVSEHFSECIFQTVNSVELLEFFHLVIIVYTCEPHVHDK